MRAIRWVLTNNPSGDSFRSHWGGDTEVSLVLSNGTMVTRRKTNSSNTYEVDGNVCKAVGRDVPEEVIKALNVSEVSVQRQHDEVFLLSKSSGEVARVLNRVANLDIIDLSMQEADRMVREATVEKTREEAELEESRVSLLRMAGIDETEETLSSLERKAKGLVASGRRAEEIHELCDAIELSDSLIGELGKDPAPVLERLASYEKRMSSLAMLSAEAEKIKGLAGSIEGMVRREKELTEDINQLAGSLKSNSCPTCGRSFDDE